MKGKPETRVQKLAENPGRGVMKPVIPRIFRERYGKLLSDKRKFYLYCQKPLRKSIRINLLKSDLGLVERLEEKGWKLRQVPWCRNGFWVEKREELLGNTPEHFLGLYYVQEAVSMLPPLLLKPKPGELVLDVAAAPGSKTSQLAEIMKNRGCIVANDPSVARLKALRANLQRLGVMNTVITRMDGKEFGRLKNRFDRVLLDAPCSAEGVIRKEWNALADWSVQKIQRLSRLQKKLILAAADSLKPGGVLVYSTCTFAPEENEEVIDFLLKKRDFKVEKPRVPGLKSRPGLTEWQGKDFESQVKRCIRIWPQDNDTEGFFIARLRKND